MQSIDSIETDAYLTHKYLVSEEEEIKWNSVIKQWYKAMINFDDVPKEKIK